MKKPCKNCGAKIDEFFEICPFCYVILIPELELERKQKKRIKSRKLKKLSIVISYIIFFISTLSWLVVSGSCYQSQNTKCYDLTLVLMILCWISCCVAPILYGEELPKWEI
ncbi:MAG: hypothetical protein ACXABO_10175 [Promethearchaeota archaeon]|jgi:hypothetical membrane protein